MIDDATIFDALKRGYYSNVCIDYIDMYGCRRYGKIIKYDEWCPFKENCEFIKWITRNHSRLDVRIAMNENGLLILQVKQVSQEPSYPIVIF